MRNIVLITINLILLGAMSFAMYLYFSFKEPQELALIDCESDFSQECYTYQYLKGNLASGKGYVNNTQTNKSEEFKYNFSDFKTLKMNEVEIVDSTLPIKDFPKPNYDLIDANINLECADILIENGINFKSYDRFFGMALKDILYFKDCAVEVEEFTQIPDPSLFRPEVEDE